MPTVIDITAAIEKRQVEIFRLRQLRGRVECLIRNADADARGEAMELSAKDFDELRESVEGDLEELRVVPVQQWTGVGRGGHYGTQTHTSLPSHWDSVKVQ